jgi:RimJ/RimL family protein N-acetyltransferase
VSWPVIEPIESVRVRLEPLTVEHAVEMVHTLSAPSLYEFIGGEPPTSEQLRRRYAAQTVGHSENNAQWWLNWVVTTRGPRCAVGYVQATVERRADTLEANIAWVISPLFQRRGLAVEAAAAMIGWLTAVGVERYLADIHPGHAASAAVARKLGLRPTDVIEDGEIRWQSSARGCGH